MSFYRVLGVTEHSLMYGHHVTGLIPIFIPDFHLRRNNEILKSKWSIALMQTSIHSCAKSHNLIYKLDVSLLIIQVYNIIPYFNSFTPFTNICRYYVTGREK